MRTLILYYSGYKLNTEKIARVFRKTIKADIINIKDKKNKIDFNINNYDLIGFGSGVYKEDLARHIYRLLDSLDLKGKKVFVFSTSGVGSSTYNNKLIKTLKSKGAIVKGKFSCRGVFITKEFSKIKIFRYIEWYAKGHPNKKDFKNAEKFIKKITK